jgi:hypothetical protein
LLEEIILTALGPLVGKLGSISGTGIRSAFAATSEENGFNETLDEKSVFGDHSFLHDFPIKNPL